MNKTKFKKLHNLDKQIEKQKQKAIIHLNKIIDYEYKKRLVNAFDFIEKDINFGSKKHPDFKKVKMKKYYDFFKDEDTDNLIKIIRHEWIEVNGVRCSRSGNEIKHLTINDI